MTQHIYIYVCTYYHILLLLLSLSYLKPTNRKQKYRRDPDNQIVTLLLWLHIVKVFYVFTALEFSCLNIVSIIYVLPNIIMVIIIFVISNCKSLNPLLLKRAAKARVKDKSNICIYHFTVSGFYKVGTNSTYYQILLLLLLLLPSCQIKKTLLPGPQQES